MSVSVSLSTGVSRLILCCIQAEQALAPYKAVFRDALKEVGVIPDLQAIIWGYFERKTFTFGGPTDGRPLDPSGICVDKKGLIRVTDTANNRVQIFAGDGQWLKSILPGPRGSPGYFHSPAAVAVAPDGSIYICSLHTVVVYQSDGKFQRHIGAGVLDSPSGVAVNADGSLVYVTDIKANSLSAFTSEGKFSHHIGKFGESGGDLGVPFGVAVGPDDNVYVADYFNCRVQIYTPSGQHVRQIGQGSTPQAFSFSPNSRSISVASDGLVYVAEFGHNRVLVFSPTGAFLYEITGLAKPSGVAVSPSGMVFFSLNSKKKIVAVPSF